MKKTIGKIIPLFCAVVMIAALSVTFLSAPASAGNILYLVGEERDPVLTPTQVDEELAKTENGRAVYSFRERQNFIRENNRKQEELDNALEEKAELDAIIADKEEILIAYYDAWYQPILNISEEPEYIAALATGDDTYAMGVVLDMIGKTWEDYEEYLQVCMEKEAEIDELLLQREQAEIRIAKLLPCYN